jgi:hypothetical protein
MLTPLPSLLMAKIWRTILQKLLFWGNNGVRTVQQTPAVSNQPGRTI